MRPSMLAFAALLIATLAAPGLAHSRVIVGFHFGIPIYYPPYYYYPPPLYYLPPPVYYPEPPVVIHAPPSGIPADSASYYYCAQSKSYYPYVRECPGGWQRVPSVPPR